jgi:hypothetical protein
LNTSLAAFLRQDGFDATVVASFNAANIIVGADDTRARRPFSESADVSFRNAFRSARTGYSVGQP